jgi:hypothetical protein
VADRRTGRERLDSALRRGGWRKLTTDRQPPGGRHARLHTGGLIPSALAMTPRKPPGGSTGRPEPAWPRLVRIRGTLGHRLLGEGDPGCELGETQVRLLLSQRCKTAPARRIRQPDGGGSPGRGWRLIPTSGDCLAAQQRYRASLPTVVTRGVGRTSPQPGTTARPGPGCRLCLTPEGAPRSGARQGPSRPLVGRPLLKR